MDREFQQKMATVVEALKPAGYVPYDQLTRYVKTKKLTYITRINDARQIIQTMEISAIHAYLTRITRNTWFYITCNLI